MKNNILIFYLAMAVIGAAIFFLPDVLPSIPIPSPISPIDPEVKMLRDGMVQYIPPNTDSEMIGASLKAAANLFTVDATRTTPVYKDIEDQKRAIRGIGDLTLGLGFHMDNKYPGLSTFLANYFENAVTTQDVTNKLNKASEAFNLL